jgi:cytochrome c-type biogenesis protein CcmF
LFRDLYIVLGEGNLGKGWVVRIYYNPLVIWIWIGAFTIFLGGALSVNNNLKKLKKI